MLHITEKGNVISLLPSSDTENCRPLNMEPLSNDFNLTETRPTYKTFEILVSEDAWVLLAVTLVGLVIVVGCTGIDI